MNVLLTGGTGFVGSHIVQNLHVDGHNVYVVKNTDSNLWRLNELKGKVHYIENTYSTLEEAFKQYQFDLIIHLASLLRVKDEDLESVINLTDTNVKFGLQILSLAAKYHVKKFINTGTFFEEEIFHAKKTYMPHNYYAVTKLQFEEALRYYTLRFAMQTITLRLFTPYGEKDNSYKFIPAIMQSFLQNSFFEVNSRDQELNLIYIQDVVNAYNCCLKKIQKSNDIYFEKFDIGGSRTYSIQDVVELIQKVSGTKGNVKMASKGKDIHMFKEADISFSKKHLGWEPVISIEEGLRKTWQYYALKK